MQKTCTARGSGPVLTMLSSMAASENEPGLTLLLWLRESYAMLTHTAGKSGKRRPNYALKYGGIGKRSTDHIEHSELHEEQQQQR
jgi:hypothetical protein